ncbi:ubiquitin carboxyl-terminal hydrolase 47-like isoform X2 [Xiphophorus couchianus]|uniref:ubiquitin carboxyl-terminal hydrolase 47-like isoform X2 n=1 Tax=Xiphophorus couchianus TaxID=32473 RepID=UPI001016AE1D|nr:ubiquitin carboxyl-terminal hydrolase 47-like isoform X2 [Xiphophorus couchianus]
MNQDIKYYGLINQGATCYLNSILQVLFMTREFREAVKRCPKENGDINVQLNVLFEDLKRNTAESTKVTEKLGIEVYEQQDAGHYLEKILSLVSDEASQIFRGELIHRTICGECRSHTEDDVPFLFLSLPLMVSKNGNFSVDDGIQEFLKDAEFCGEDQLYCDHCEDNRDTTVKYKLQHHPEILILLLKRFEYNYNHMSYSKDSRPVDVCYTINLPENQTYEMYAMVDHFGTLRGGHYTATIKPEEEESWYEFNDSSVTLLGNQMFQGKFEKSRSAHLLFYRKQSIGLQNEGQDEEEGQRDLAANHNLIVELDQRPERTCWYQNNYVVISLPSSTGFCEASICTVICNGVANGVTQLKNRIFSWF